MIGLSPEKRVFEKVSLHLDPFREFQGRHGVSDRSALLCHDHGGYRSRFLIHLYSIGYMHGEEGFYRFFAYLNLFMYVHAAAGAGQQHAAHVRRLGGCRSLLLPADRLLLPQKIRRGRRQEGFCHEPRRRLRLPARPVYPLLVAWAEPQHLDHQFTELARLHRTCCRTVVS